MENDLVALVTQATSAANVAAGPGIPSDRAAVSRCLDALRELSNFPITFNLRTVTPVDDDIQSLLEHPLEEIKAAAKQVRQMWKFMALLEVAEWKRQEIMDAPPSEEKQAEASPREAGVEREKEVEASNLEENAARKTETEHAEPDSDAAGRSPKPDVNKKQKMDAASEEKKIPGRQESVVDSGNAKRNRIRHRLVVGLSKVAGEAGDDIRDRVNARDPVEVAIAAECAILKAMDNLRIKKSKLRSILFNLEDPKNPDLRRKVLLGEVEPERLLEMTSEEMASDKLKREYTRLKGVFASNEEGGYGSRAGATTDQSHSAETAGTTGASTERAQTTTP